MKKLEKYKLPKNHSFADFNCKGPVASKDGEFEECNIVDLGCFKQDGTDTNKYYFGAIVQSALDNSYYVYFESGKTGATKPLYQFIQCDNEAEARTAFAKQIHSKNDKRGQWVEHKVLGKVLQAKPGKDCYLVRQQSSRNTLMVNAKNICNVDKVHTSSSYKEKLDQPTIELLSKLSEGTTTYTQSIIEGNNVPTISAIDEARQILSEATKITNKMKSDKYSKNKELVELTTMIYSRIPKFKALGDDNWILTPENISKWQTDLDAFESANQAGSFSTYDSSFLNEFGLKAIKHLDKNSKYGYWVKDWWESANRNRHSYLGNLKAKNIWYIDRNDEDSFTKYQKKLGKCNTEHKPYFQESRKDKFDKELFDSTNSFLLFHGTRTVNTGSIIKSGLRLPQTLSSSQITGALFGGGLYFADDTKKSVGYTSYSGSYYSNGSGDISGLGAMMFIFDVALGNMEVASYGRTKSAGKGYHSVFAKGGVSGVQNNEFIVYDTNAVRMRYLVEFE